MEIVDNHLWTHDATFTKTYPLTNIDKIEVLYGPASAVYGANAFLGVINIITKSARALKSGEFNHQVSLQSGSFSAKSIELFVEGRQQDFNYSFASKVFRSDEPGISDYAPWGYLSNELLSNRDIWGPVIFDSALSEECDAAACPHSTDGKVYGVYHDRSKDYGVLAKVGYKTFSAGIISWEMKEGYGPYYPSDRAQPGSYWNRSSDQFFLRNQMEINGRFNVNTLSLYRESRIWGEWAEAFPQSNALTGPETGSLVSISSWNSINESHLLEQEYRYQFNERLTLHSGIKYQRKDLTRAYDLCSYYADAFCSSESSDQQGEGIADSSDSTINIQPGPLASMPESNRAKTTDKGGFLQLVWVKGNWRFNAGVRYDTSSLFGSSTNPRLSVCPSILE